VRGQHDAGPACVHFGRRVGSRHARVRPSPRLAFTKAGKQLREFASILTWIFRSWLMWGVDVVVVFWVGSGGVQGIDANCRPAGGGERNCVRAADGVGLVPGEIGRAGARGGRAVDRVHEHHGLLGAVRVGVGDGPDLQPGGGVEELARRGADAAAHGADSARGERAHRAAVGEPGAHHAVPGARRGDHGRGERLLLVLAPGPRRELPAATAAQLLPLPGIPDPDDVLRRARRAPPRPAQHSARVRVPPRRARRRHRRGNDQHQCGRLHARVGETLGRVQEHVGGRRLGVVPARVVARAAPRAPQLLTDLLGMVVVRDHDHLGGLSPESASGGRGHGDSDSDHRAHVHHSHVAGIVRLHARRQRARRQPPRARAEREPRLARERVRGGGRERDLDDGFPSRVGHSVHVRRERARAHRRRAPLDRPLRARQLPADGRLRHLARQRAPDHHRRDHVRILLLGRHARRCGVRLLAPSRIPRLVVRPARSADLLRVLHPLHHSAHKLGGRVLPSERTHGAELTNRDEQAHEQQPQSRADPRR
jgi:hypothetical protein